MTTNDPVKPNESEANLRAMFKRLLTDYQALGRIELLDEITDTALGYADDALGRLRADYAAVVAELDEAKRYANEHMDTAAWHAKQRRLAEAENADLRRQLDAVLAACNEADRLGWHRNAGAKVRAAAAQPAAEPTAEVTP